jgi:hypothetical protein
MIIWSLTVLTGRLMPAFVIFKGKAFLPVAGFTIVFFASCTRYFFLAHALLTLILSEKFQNPALNFMPAAVLQFIARTKGASCEKLL